jgi:hypothetical protein
MTSAAISPTSSATTPSRNSAPSGTRTSTRTGATASTPAPSPPVSSGRYASAAPVMRRSLVRAPPILVNGDKH